MSDVASVNEVVVEEELITTSEVARILGKAEGTIRLWRIRGTLRPSARTSTGTALYRRRDVLRFKARLEATSQRVRLERERKAAGDLG